MRRCLTPGARSLARRGAAHALAKVPHPPAEDEGLPEKDNYKECGCDRDADDGKDEDGCGDEDTEQHTERGRDTDHATHKCGDEYNY